MCLVALWMIATATPQSGTEPFAAYAVQDEQVAVSPDGRWAGLVSDGSAFRVDARSKRGDVMLASDAMSVAVGNDGDFYIGKTDGVVVCVDANGGRTELRAHENAAIDGLSLRGNTLGWWCVGRSVGGILDLQARKELAGPLFEVERQGQQPALQLAADGRHAVYRSKSNDHEASAYAVVFDFIDGKEVARLPCYATRRADFVIVGGQVANAVRRDVRTWHLNAFDFASRTSRTIDPALRGGHFVDLFASPSGGWVVEGDFEEGEAARWQLDSDAGRRALFAAGHRPVGCGSVRLGQSVTEVALLVENRTGEGLSAWRLDDGTRTQAALPRANYSVISAGTLGEGRCMWVWRRVVAPKGEELRAEFFAID